MKVTTTAQGYQSVQFVDQAGNSGVLEQSKEIDPSNPTADQPGTSYVLLGRKDSVLQLNIDQVSELVEYLQKWLEEGKFVKGSAGSHGKHEVWERRIRKLELAGEQGCQRTA
jgi:hypothetical protein